ncbi:MAG: hypothetical protein NTW19_15205 [Planctomycetota bacterium]|nr:hypothetical protein [Planctomycetota bacterium]
MTTTRHARPPRPLLLLLLLLACASTLAPRDARAAEAVVLNPENFDAYAPAGREADAIYGDFVLRNDRITAAVANFELITGRGGSRGSTSRNLGGNLIDFTPRTGPGAGNDQLGWTSLGVRFGNSHSDFENGTAHYLVDYAKDFPAQSGPRVQITVPHIPHHPEKFNGEARYILEDGWPYLLCELEYFNPADLKPPVNLHIAQRKPPADDASIIEDIATGPPPAEKIIPMPDEAQPPIEPTPLTVSPYCGLGSDAVVDRGSDASGKLQWIYDSHFRQAYGLLSEPDWTLIDAKGKSKTISAKSGSASLLPGERLVVRRRAIVGVDLFAVRAIANDIQKIHQRRLRLVAKGPDGPVTGALVNAYVEVSANSATFYAAGRTDDKGLLEIDLPDGRAELRIDAPARKPQVVTIDDDRTGDVELAYEAAAGVTFAVTDDKDQPIPCKVEFRGREGTATPDFFPVNGEQAVKNLRYAADGKGEQLLAPGHYQALISRGPAYDAVALNFTLAPGQRLPLRARLRRGVDTADWIAADLHTYTTVSGPTWNANASGASRAGRVLNLACEEIQFAPGAEYNFISTYQPEIHALGLDRFLVSCPGVALGDVSKYAYNQQYAFPVELKPHWQDGGMPQRPQHCGQIEWLYSWGAPIDPLNPWRTAGKPGYDKLMTLMQSNNNPATAQLRVPMSSMYKDRDVPAWWSDDSALIRPMFRDTNDDGIPERVHHNFASYMSSLDVRTLEPLLDPLTKGVGDDKHASKARLENDVIDWLRMRTAGYRMTGLINSGAFHNFHGAGGLRNYIQVPGKTLADLQPADVIKAIRAGHVVMTTGPFLEATVTTDEGKQGIAGDTVATSADHARLHVRVQCPNWITLDRVYVLRDGKPDPALDFTREKLPKAFGPAPTLEGFAVGAETKPAADASGSPASAGPAFDATIDLPIKADTQLVVLALGHGPNLRAMRDPKDLVARHVALTNPILIDHGNDGFAPQNPIDDSIEAFLRIVRPVKSDPKAPLGMVRLTLINHGDKPAKDIVHVDIKSLADAHLKGPSDIPFTVAPGEKARIDLEIELAADAQTMAMIGSGPKLSAVIYVPRVGRAPGVAPARIKVVTDDFPKLDNLDEAPVTEPDLGDMR